VYRHLLQSPGDKGALEGAKQVLTAFRSHPLYAAIKSGDLERRYLECCPRSWVDENGNCRKSEVAAMVGMMVDSFPSSKIRNPETFVRLLIDDVVSWNPDFGALESACRTLRQTKKSMPSICEVKEQYEKAREKWFHRWLAIEDVEFHYDEMAALVAHIEQLASAPLVPLKLGDRVNHPDDGHGSVVEIGVHQQMDKHYGRAGYLLTVAFDDYSKKSVFDHACLRLAAPPVGAPVGGADDNDGFG
jgi:hypothetical protein